MTREQEIALRNFEARVRQLMSAYKEVLLQNRNLNCELENCKKQLSEGQAQIKQQAQQYEDLRTARIIDKLIREVDKCIALLDV